MKPDLKNGTAIAAISSVRPAYKETHSLIEEKIVPDGLLRLRQELQHPRHNKLMSLALKGKDFAECLAIIAAELGIVVDGYYDVDKLCNVLYKALCQHNGVIKNIPELIPAELKETEDSIEITHRPDAFTMMMREAGCAQCDNKAACTKAGHCLGDDSNVFNLTKQQKEEFGK